MYYLIILLFNILYLNFFYIIYGFYSQKYIFVMEKNNNKAVIVNNEY